MLEPGRDKKLQVCLPKKKPAARFEHMVNRPMSMLRANDQT
jgi:hypothetical protein